MKKFKDLFPAKDWALLKQFRNLPVAEREELHEKAQKIVEEITQVLPQAIIDTPSIDNETKKSVIESIFGPLDTIEEDALKDDSKFSRFYNVAIISAIIETMKEYNEASKGKNLPPLTLD